MNRKINNLEELLQEKARLQVQIKIVETEMNASFQRTRQELTTLIEEKFSLSKQIGQLFQGGEKQGVGTTALQAVGRVAAGGTWWGGIAASLLPLVIDFVRRQIERRKEKKAAKPAVVKNAAPPIIVLDNPDAATPKPARRGLFKRKKKDTGTAE